MASTSQLWNDRAATIGAGCLRFGLRPLELLVRAPEWVFVGTLGIMLLRAPDLAECWADRVAFAVLILTVFLRAVLLQQSLRPRGMAVWAMLGLIVLVFTDLLATPYDVQLWSVAAAKYVVPYALFYLAGLVFEDETRLRPIELFIIVAFAYLTLTSIAYVAGWSSLVFPRFILDANLGTHVNRARGPFLQAQANGTAINLLGLLVLDFYRRRRLRGMGAVVLMLSYPVAILTTKTRGVWLAFAVSTVLLAWWTDDRRVRRLCFGLILTGALGLAALTVHSIGSDEGVHDRLTDGGTVDFRMAAYQAGWEMFRERPLKGWGASRMEQELADRIDGFRGEVFVVHNTYFEVLLEYGILGFALYVSILLALLGMCRSGPWQAKPEEESLLGALQGPLWPLMLATYLLSANFVVMNYQFVNALIFTFAGILSVQKRTRQSEEHLFAN